MIFDRLKNITLYKDYHKSMAIAVKYLENAGWANYPPGKYEIDGLNVYISIQQYNTKEYSEGHWESHRRYIDIQYVSEGWEKMGYANLADMKPLAEFDHSKDINFYTGEGDFFTVPAGAFAIFGPEDVHMPGIMVNKPELVKKAVLKILI